MLMMLFLRLSILALSILPLVGAEVIPFPSLIGQKIVQEIPEFRTLEGYLIRKLCRKRIKIPLRATHAVLSPDKAFIACTGAEGLFLWNVATATSEKVLDAFADEVTHYLLFSPKGCFIALVTKYLPVYYTEPRLRIWDVEKHEPIILCEKTDAVIFHKDTVILVCHDHTIEVWELEGKTRTHTIDSMLHGIIGLAIAQNRLLAFTTTKHAIWDLNSGNRLKRDSGIGGTDGAWFPHAGRYVIYDTEKRIAEEQYVIPTWHPGNKTKVAASAPYTQFKLAPSGLRSLAFTDQSVLLYDIPAEEFFVLQRYQRVPFAMAFSSDSKQVLVGTNTTDQPEPSCLIDLFDIQAVGTLQEQLTHSTYEQLHLYYACAQALIDKAPIHPNEQQVKIVESLPLSFQEALTLYLRKGQSSYG